jgi:hypothetical protein
MCRAKAVEEAGGGENSGNGKVEIKRGQRTRMVNQKTTGSGPRVKNELKSKMEIAKGRKEMENKRAKNGRHAPKF